MAADADQTRRFLGALFGGAPVGSWIELRFRVGAGMGRSFHPADRLDRAVAAAVGLAARTEVFVGVLARACRGGGRRDLIHRAATVWADCDGPAAVRALKDFRPAPALIVATGSGENRHAYWFLREPIEIAALEHTNRRLAATLAADPQSCDAARILRVAGSPNHKHLPPTTARLLTCDEHTRVALADLTSRLAPDPAPTGRHAIAPPRALSSDPLLALAPRAYVERLLGQPVGRSGKVHCPFHADDTPSLHVYQKPGRGWYCFGCGRGGTVYDLAALLWSIPPRGRRFNELREQLAAELDARP